MEFKVLDKHGNYTDKKICFDDKMLSNKKYDNSVYLENKRYLLAQRQGTHKSKERGEISGSNRKLHRQKGTGSSRKGNIKNPIFRGGGRVFGPKPRKYLIKINKNTKSKVKKFLIEEKIINKKINIIENIQIKFPKTKFFVTLLKSIKLYNVKLLIISGDINKNLYLSSRNLKLLKFIHINELNCFYLLNFPNILLFENCIDKIYKYLSYENNKKL
ncbi:50S ribosomal protein L4 [Blattabacterium cuenoti]|uniref:50S ribosomal protein L4 n=1 Tax=Blattabacterium cuenoti TaxID=1653831 RepID=UPI00163B9FD8|nr:50S ribosomal protein L4 [Blattabacterium cuenoti]